MNPEYSFQLKHDQEDRIIEKVETVKNRSVKWTYTYDKAGRLFEAKLDGRLICQCHYDKYGRRNQDYFPRVSSDLRRYNYTGDDRLQSVGSNFYTHDKNGFRIDRKSGV